MEQIAPLLEKLAVKLGVTAEYLWSVLLFQAYLEWITPAITTGVLIIVGIVFHHFRNRESKKERMDRNDETVTGFDVAGWAAYLIALLPGGITLWYVFMAIVNPAYLALDKILSILK